MEDSEVTFSLIYADPPWHWAARSQKGEDRSAKNHYQVMTLEDIKKLPVSSIAADPSVLAMWVIDPMLPQALELGRAWGYKFATVGLYWIKTNKGSPIQFDGTRISSFLVSAIQKTVYPVGEIAVDGPSVFFKGLGYYTRANPEQLWLFTREKNKELGIQGGGIPRVDRNVDRLLVAPVGRHSAKPDEAALRLERLFGDVPRIELFARTRRPGWEAFGNEIPDSYKLENE